MHKIGKCEVTTEQFAAYTKSSKEEIAELLLISTANMIDRDEAQLKRTAGEVHDLEQELESTEEINDDLRADLELKDKTIRSLVDVCRHLASKAV
jgi:hypothetical protein